MEPKIVVEFAIFGDLWDSPEELTEILQIFPTEIGYKGAPIPQGKMPCKVTHYYRETFWEYSTSMFSYYIDDLSIHLLNLFKPKIDMIKEYMSEKQLSAKIDFVTYSTPDNFPSLYLSPQIIEFAGKIKASIDFDVYIEESES